MRKLLNVGAIGMNGSGRFFSSGLPSIGNAEEFSRLMAEVRAISGQFSKAMSAKGGVLRQPPIMTVINEAQGKDIYEQSISKAIVKLQGLPDLAKSAVNGPISVSEEVELEGIESYEELIDELYRLSDRLSRSKAALNGLIIKHPIGLLAKDEEEKQAFSSKILRSGINSLLRISRLDSDKIKQLAEEKSASLTSVSHRQ